jgi:malonate-semialdehyde dehydrogenase (acetylating) / methylmalonate-semialdehyde dehydrogenase
VVVRLPNYIGGAWVGTGAVETLADVDPASGETLAEVPLSGATEVEAAVAAARAAQPGWRELPPQRRARAVLALREELLERREELAALVSADMGKTLADADGEVGRGLESVESAAAIPHLLKGETLEGVAAGVDVESVRQPVGVVAAITPFNFPAMIPLWFLPYAIACGNTFILKPSEIDPQPAALISAAVNAVDEIPPGVFNLVHGAHDAVNALLDHPGIDAISFVGQAKTARMVAERGVASGKRVQALGGAKNSLVVMPDADLEQATAAIMGSAFGAAGQRCLAGSVCVVVGDEARRAQVRQALVAAAAELRVGPGDDPATDICPMVSAAARERVVDAIERAEAEDAELLLDGRRPRRHLARADHRRRRRPRVRAGPRGAVRPAAGAGRGGRPRRGDRVRQRLPLRQCRLDLHPLGRCGAAVSLRGRGRHARRQRRGTRPNRLVPLLRLERLDRRRPARQRHRCRGLLHAEEGRY